MTLYKPKTYAWQNEAKSIVSKIKAIRLTSLYEPKRVLVLCDTHDEQLEFMNVLHRSGMHPDTDGNFMFEIIRTGQNPMPADIPATHVYLSAEAKRVINDANNEMMESAKMCGVSLWFQKGLIPDLSQDVLVIKL